MPTFGLEEEVFVTEPERPSLASLVYLARLLARDPRFYYTHTASNFARGRDVRCGLMSGVEFSTGVHTTVEGLLKDFSAQRRRLARVVDGLIVAAGHLLQFHTPTSVCSLQLHLGRLPDKDRAYNNIAWFLPLVSLITANAPAANLSRMGKSVRIQNSFAIGPLRQDRYYRFQDLIYSRRLGTIEVRIADPCPDMERIRIFVKVLDALALSESRRELDLDRYSRLRHEAAKEGYTGALRELYRELRDEIEVDESFFLASPADRFWDAYRQHGLVGAYSALDNQYRGGALEPARIPHKSWARKTSLAAAGFVGYFIPKLPYYIWKATVENRRP